MNNSMYRYSRNEEIGVSNVYLQWAHNTEVVTLPKGSFYTIFGKRIFDIIVASLVTVLILSWLIPLVGLLIICESNGPFLFVQMRSGRKGRSFPCLKFRTMYHMPNTGEFRQTRRDDERITRLGRFLRKTNIDEMPQFLNVLVGDMSLVGPRPHALAHDAQHWDSAAYRERYWVKPGITGLAQVRGSRGATSKKQLMEHRVRYDHFYISRQTLLFDISICMQTLKLTLKGDSNAW